MTQTTTKLEELSNKLVNQIQNLHDKTGQPGTLKDFQNFTQVERFSDALWEHGLQSIDSSNFLEELNKKIQNFKKPINQQKTNKIIPSPTDRKQLEGKTSPNNIVQYMEKVIEAGINKVQDEKDLEVLRLLGENMADIVKKILRSINEATPSLKEYPIRTLVKDTEEFGKYIKNRNLRTNQIRKFLDAVNRIKLDLKLEIKKKNIDEDQSQALLLSEFRKIDVEFVLLKQKLAYASAREPAVKPLKEVMEAAIDKVRDSKDFERFFQLVESIIAYHKAAGGKD
jgi:CRISPR-associated protein Csm2